MKKAITILLCVAALAAFGFGGTALARSAAHAGLTWSVIGSGGAIAQSAHASIDATVGQPAIAEGTSTHTGIDNGYWAPPILDKIYYIPAFAGGHFTAVR